MPHGIHSCFKPRSCDTGPVWRPVAGRGFRFEVALAVVVISSMALAESWNVYPGADGMDVATPKSPDAGKVAVGESGKNTRSPKNQQERISEVQRVSFTDRERARLDKGDILVELRTVEGESAPEAIVRAVIDAEPERVWPLIDHCGDYVGVMPRITKATELERKGEVVRCSLRFSPPWPLSDMDSITVAWHRTGPPVWSRVWELESGDYKLNSGHWIVHAFGSDPQRTVVEYRLHSEPNVSVPRFLQDMGVKTALPDLIRQLRKAAKERVASQ